MPGWRPAGRVWALGIAPEEGLLSRQRKVFRADGYGYLLHLPPGPPGPGGWPLLLFLHGIGERGADLEAVGRHGPPRVVVEGRNLPLAVGSPPCPGGRYWSVPLLTALLDHALGAYAVDPERVYLTGLSMGGHAAWALAVEQPWRFAAVAPVCGGGDPRKAGRLARLPVWAFHGAQDPVVPVAASRAMVEALRRCGGRAELTVYDDAGHDAWTRTYAGEELYAWLLSHVRRRAGGTKPAGEP